MGSVSEIDPLTTEAVMTDASAGVDDLSAVPNKRTTTVAMDFGRVSLDSDLILYLFGTPGQDRFWFMWDDLVRGAIGAVVLADTRRLADCFAAVDFFEDRRLPYVLGVNCFDGMLRHDIEDVREALAIDPSVPILTVDARDRESTKQALDLARRARHAGLGGRRPRLIPLAPAMGVAARSVATARQTSLERVTSAPRHCADGSGDRSGSAAAVRSGSVPCAGTLRMSSRQSRTVRSLRQTGT